jgi:tetratricopeptide (TPR) repeat protein
MEWIWKFESLVELLDHREALVREWAMERLITLYPETAGPVAIRHISDPVEGVAQAALSHFIDRPDGACADELLKAYAACTGDWVGMIAGALSRLKDARLIEAFQEKFSHLTRDDLQGYAVSVVHIADLQTPATAAVAAGALRRIGEMGEPVGKIREPIRWLFSANLEAGNSIGPLLEFCFARSDWRPWLSAFLIALGDECGTFYIEADFEEYDLPGAAKRGLPESTQESFAALASAGFEKESRELEKNYRKRRYADILNFMHERMLSLSADAERRVGAERFARWARGRGKPRQHLAAIEALCKQVSGKDPAAQKLMVNAGLGIFAALMELRNLIGLEVEALGMEELLKIFLEDRIPVEEDLKIAARLRAAPDQGGVVEAILTCIENDPGTRAMERLLDYLAEGMDVQSAERLLKVPGDSFELIQSLPRALSRLGAPLLDLLPALIEARTPDGVTRSLSLIRQLPLEGSVNLLVKHWELFWELDKFSLLEAVQDIGDRRFIPALKRELQAIEIPEARTYQLLCLIHGQKDPLLKKIEAYVERESRKRSDSLEAFESGDLTPLLDQPLELELKCRRCRKTYRYEVHEVTSLSGTKGDFLIADHIRCKNCGAVDDYEKTPEADLAVTGRGIALLAMGDKGLKLIEKGPLRFVASRRIGGKVRSMEEALQYYEELLAKKPGHVPHLIGYANTLSNVKRADEALSAYRQALEYDPLAVEALVSLGQNAAAYGDWKEAYAWFEKAVAVLDSGNYYHVSQDLKEFKAEVYDVYARSALALGKYVPAPGSVRAAAPKKVKVGRNDPCPCGSGRKYKKCCLAK